MPARLLPWLKPKLHRIHHSSLLSRITFDRIMPSPACSASSNNRLPTLLQHSTNPFSTQTPNVTSIPQSKYPITSAIKRLSVILKSANHQSVAIHRNLLFTSPTAVEINRRQKKESELELAIKSAVDDVGVGAMLHPRLYTPLAARCIDVQSPKTITNLHDQFLCDYFGLDEDRPGTFGVKVVPEDHLTHYWKLCRFICSALLKRREFGDATLTYSLAALESAVSVVEKGARHFRFPRKEQIGVMIPFLVGIVDKESALYSRRGCGELDEDLDCKLAVRILLDIVNEMVASQPSTQLKNVSESVDEDARIKHYNWILLLSPRVRLIYCSIVLKHLLITGQISPAITLFNQTVSQLDIHFNQQDVNTLYGTMIHGLSRRNLITEALAILQRGIESPAHQYTPDVSNVSPVLECMIRKQQMTKAFQFLEWLLKERKGFVVDEKSLQVVYWGCLRSVGYKPGKRSVQRSVLREMGLTHVEYQYSLVSKAREVFLDGIGRLINIVGVDGERDLRSRAYSAMLFEHVFLKEREISELVLGDATKDGVDVSANTLKAMKELYPINSDGRKLLGYEIRRIESDITMIDTVPSKEVHVLGDLTDLYDMEEFNDYEYWTKG